VVTCYDLFAICYMLYVISGMLFWYMLFVLPVVCRLLHRCWLPSHKNFAALKKFGVCDNKHFDFDFDFDFDFTVPVYKTAVEVITASSTFSNYNSNMLLMLLQ